MSFITQAEPAPRHPKRVVCTMRTDPSAVAKPLVAILVAFMLSTALACESPPPRAARQTPTDQTRAFRPNPLTKPLPTPQSGDWLARFDETGQTFEEWKASEPNRPRPDRKVIALQPVGAFGQGSVPLPLLEKFTRKFFGLPVKVLPTIPTDRFAKVAGNTHGPQLLTNEALDTLRQTLPPDAYCMLGITMFDLTPGADWNFVFGMGSLSERTGIFSFARYASTATDDEARRTLMVRALKILAHETGHMFGFKHCTANLCLMNGSNSITETDRQPLQLCPICLQKLHDVIGFDVAERDLALAQVLEDAGLQSEAAAFERRRAWLLGL